MRVFAAIALPEDLTSRLAAVAQELQPASRSAKWVRPESIHITLKFLGEIPEKQLEVVHEALAGLTWKPLTIAVKGLGFFPGKRSPRVLWAGMQSSTLEELAAKIEVRMDRLGFEKEQRAYRAHLTLARAGETRLEPELVAAAAQFEETEFGTFVVDRFYLYQTTMEPSGPVYTRLREYHLGRV